MHAVSRVLAAALDATGPAAVQAALVREARTLFGADGAYLLSVDPVERLARMLAYDADAPPAQGRIALSRLPGTEDLRRPWIQLEAAQLGTLGRSLALALAPQRALVLPMRTRDATDHLLILAGGAPTPEACTEAAELAAGFAAAAASALAQLRLVQAQAAQTAQQASLARAAKTLNATLELPAVLHAICTEAKAILDSDNAAAYIGEGPDGHLVIQACIGLSGDALGRRVAPDEGLCSRVARADRAMLTNDYARVVRPAATGPFTEVQSCIAVPMHWDGALRGVLSIGYNRPHFATAQDLALLEAFAEIGAAACRNASAAAGLALAARTDGLTGCLNHAALQESLAREVQRAERTGDPLAVVLLDLDDFKSVNELEGHLVGDEVLRQVGRALRVATRPYDVVARYGGDEFAIVAIGAGELVAEEIATRAIERVHDALEAMGRPLGTIATAGIAELPPGATATALLEDADRALLYGKQVIGRGHAVTASCIPGSYRTRDRELPAGRPGRMVATPRAAGEPTPSAAVHDRLAKRTRQLALAGSLGARLATLAESTAIIEAVVDELHRAFGSVLVAALVLDDHGHVRAVAGRGRAFADGTDPTAFSQPRDAGIIGRALREKQVQLVGDVALEAEFSPGNHAFAVRSELVAPVWIGDRLWGVLNLEELTTDAFDGDDARLLAIAADQVGGALRAVELHARVQRAYRGTAEALAAALEARGAPATACARSLVPWALGVGQRLGLDDEGLRALRHGATFHAIGTLGVPESILGKPGALTPEEREVVERHTLVGEQILAPVEFLADVLPIVRHEHERWDGTGYPDGLRGMRIPLASRIILVCDAFHAMTSDRPHRAALSREEALAELEANAGTQFDPLVVDAFLTVLEQEAPAPDGEQERTR